MDADPQTSEAKCRAGDPPPGCRLEPRCQSKVEKCRVMEPYRAKQGDIGLHGSGLTSFSRGNGAKPKLTARTSGD